MKYWLLPVAFSWKGLYNQEKQQKEKSYGNDASLGNRPWLV